MSHSSAHIIQQLLIDRGHGQSPDKTGNDWDIFYDNLPPPDIDKVAYRALVVHGTAGVNEGKLMTGSLPLHPGIQVRSRARVTDDCEVKLREIMGDLAIVLNKTVVIDTVTYTVQALSPTTDVIPLGINEEHRSHSATSNYTITVRKETP